MARELTRVKTVVSLNSSLYAERTVDAVITEGRFRKHAIALRAKTRNATRAALTLFDEHGVEVFARPEQSLYLWARLPDVDDSLSFARQMFERGIAMAPGVIFSPDASSISPWFRFNVGFLGADSAIGEVLSLT
ncbi:putative transcriptional regulator, GntR family [Comamonas thiooxydans]|nr:putative transcriptional regulator, GntR family [Comamonas thiooxydans]